MIFTRLVSRTLARSAVDLGDEREVYALLRRCCYTDGEIAARIERAIEGARVLRAAPAVCRARNGQFVRRGGAYA